MQNYSYLPPMGVGQPGTVEPGGVQQLNFRDPLDAARSGMAGFIPSAQWPDGYLGTIQSRREDRMLDSLKGQINQRSYQRGVHKGEKIDAADYFWPGELQPDRGLRAEAGGRVFPPDPRVWVPRAKPLGTVAEQMTVSGATELPTTPRGKLRPPPMTYDNPSAPSLRTMLPSWR
jgi:hypothetical protein